MFNQAWYVPFTTSVSISDWSKRVSSYDVGLLVLFRCWVYIDIAVAYSYGSEHRLPLFHNWRLVICGLIFAGLITFTLFTSAAEFNCALQINCDAQSNMAASSSFINNFLFKYEKVGGPWYGNIDSLILPYEFRFVALSMVLMMSVIHHIGYRVVILGPVSRWIHEKVGWTDIYSCCSCCRRRRKSGYRRLDSLQERDSMNLNDSVLSADESDSPAAEWEARRTFGKWRAPAPVQYK